MSTNFNDEKYVYMGNWGGHEWYFNLELGPNLYLEMVEYLDGEEEKEDA